MNIRRIFEKRGMAPQELAEKMGVTQQAVSYILNKEDNVSMATLTKLADILGCKVSDFFLDESEGHIHADTFQCPCCGATYKFRVSSPHK